MKANIKSYIIDKFKIMINSNYIYILGYILFISFGFIGYYRNGCLVLGGEGNTILNYSTFLKSFGFAWHHTYGTGLANMGPCMTGLNVIGLMLIQKITGSVVFANFISVFMIYFLPFFAMFLVCKKVKTTPFIAFVIAFFYVINPFTLVFLSSLNQWNLFIVTIMPIFFLVLLEYYDKRFELFFVFGILSGIFSFAYTNPPLFGIGLISIFLSIIIASYYLNKKISVISIIKKYIFLLTALVVFNFWWLMTLLVNVKSVAQNIYPLSVAQNWLDSTLGNFKPVIVRMLSLTVLVCSDPSYDFSSFWYSSFFSKLILMVPIFIVFYYFLFIKNKANPNRVLCWVTFSILVMLLFLVKGNAPPFGSIYNFLFAHIPFFKIFKTPVEKFGILYVYILSLLLLFIFNEIKHNKHFKMILNIFVAYLIFCSIPVITGNIVPNYRTNGYGYASRKFKDKAVYQKSRKLLNEKMVQQKILSLPGSGNYQVCLNNYEDNKYTGLDPLLKNVNKPFIGTHHQIVGLYKNISAVNYEKILKIYNIGIIVINSDLLPWFGFVEHESLSELKKIFNEKMTLEQDGDVIIFSNNNYFLPLIYAD
ncbi:MAG: hypothetical protein KJ915_02910 [Candidatus Omnitrophica bacterium]|nr:hypothetical protein [Candidatus Omnitrophota bacterium]